VTALRGPASARFRRAATALVFAAVATITTVAGQPGTASAAPAGTALGTVAAASGPACPGRSADDTAVTLSDFAKVDGIVPRPVVLVHGWDSSYKAMEGYAHLLDTSKVLHEPLHAFLFDYSADSGRWAAIPAIAACLAGYVNAVSAAYRNAGGDGKVLAVGHSMGGLAIRFSASGQHAAHPDGGNLGGVVTIDTPHLGSPWGDTPQAQLLQDGTQFVNRNYLEGMFPLPAGGDGQVCLATHDGPAGMPLGCATPSWLPASVPVAEVAGDITVHRDVLGFNVATSNTNGDAVVATPSSLGYAPDSGPGAPPVGTQAAVTYVDGCDITTGQLEAGIGGLGSSAIDSLVSALLALGTPAGDDIWNSPLSKPFTTLLSLANITAPCSHTNIENPVTDPFAALDVLRALNADLDRLNARPTEASLLQASGMPRATAPIAVPGGYEAAAWDEAGHITFWKWAAGTTTWSQVGASTYPVLRTEPIDTTITGALLSGMTDATFIASGFFSGDGTGRYIAFTHGPHSWGTIAPEPGEVTLIPTGNASTDNTTPGNSYAEFFSDGDLDRLDTGSLPFGPNGEEWEVGRTYTWNGGEFREVSTTQFTATPATPLPQTTQTLPPAACQGAQSGTYQDFAISATTTFTTPLEAAGLPASVTLHVQGDGPGAGECNFTVAPDFPVVISAQTASGTTWITAPAWALTQGTNGNQDIGELLSGLQLPGQYAMGSVQFQDPTYSPYYIPKSLGILQTGQLGSPILSIRNGQLTALTLLPS
jgi:pimeloyl-ACP methyl ester carboxylesterase